MSRKLHKILGYYVPAFFEMHVDTDADDLTINKPNKQGVITNKNLRYIIIQLNPALRFGVQYLIMC